MNKLLLLLAVACLGSCSVAQPVWDGTKNVVGTVVETTEDGVVWVYDHSVGYLLPREEETTDSEE